jgi:hypothetical protein
MRRSCLLGIDALINLVLGALLVAFPTRLVEFLGIPPAESRFYPSVLGGVLMGIGIALLMERRRSSTSNLGGLGLGGAVAINLSAGIVLAAWLVAGQLHLPLRGTLFLWGLVVMLVVITAFEIVVQTGRDRAERAY